MADCDGGSDDPPTAAAYRQGRIDEALLIGAIMGALAILWAAERLDRLATRARWHVGLALVRVAEQLDRVGGRLLPDEPPPGTEDAHTVAIIQAIAAAEDPRPSRPLRSIADLWRPREQGNGHVRRNARRGPRAGI